MATSRLEQLSGSMQRYTKEEAKTYNDVEREEARIDSKPIHGEAYVLITPKGKGWVTFTTCVAEAITKKRARKKISKTP